MNDEMNNTIFERIRNACRRVAERARNVTIGGDAIDRLAGELPVDPLVDPGIDDEHHITGPGDDTVAFILTLDAINFGSGYFPALRSVDGRSGYQLVARALRDRFRRAGPFSARQLAELTKEDCGELFGQPLDGGDREELMGLFAKALRQLGELVAEDYGGSFTAVVDAAAGRAARLVEILAEMPMYRDVADYGELQVPLYKRAQITASDLHLALGGEPPADFDDLDDLTMFADNQVPHVLRVDGVLRYSDRLSDRLEQNPVLESGSPEEVEIRACGVHAVELLVEALRSRGVDTTARAVDNVLWARGETPPHDAGAKHRTKTVYY